MRSLCKRRPFLVPEAGPSTVWTPGTKTCLQELVTATLIRWGLKMQSDYPFLWLRNVFILQNWEITESEKKNGLGILPWASQVALVVKNPSVNAGDSGSIPGLEDPLEEEMTTQSTILVWEIPWTKEAGGLQSMGSQSRTWMSTWAQTAYYSRTTINNLYFFPVVLDMLHKFAGFVFFLNTVIKFYLVLHLPFFHLDFFSLR